MADIIKKNMTEIWASAGDVQAPDPVKIRAGWIVEAVPRQWWNWFENRQDNNIAYMLQKGIPEWDAETEYQTNKSYVQRNNIVYKATAVSTNKDPALAANSGLWVKAFVDSTPYLEKLKTLPVTPGTVPFIDAAGNAVLNPIGVIGSGLLASPNATDARSIIGAQQYHPNLSYFSAVAGATNTLPYFNTATSMAGTPITAAARTLLSQQDMPNMRSTLGLGTAATANAQNTLYATQGLMYPGAFGLGGYSLISTAATINVNDPNCPNGFYDVAPNSIAGFVAPVTGTWTRILHQAHANTNGFATQIATADFATPGNAAMYVRKAAGTGWSTWTRFMMAEDYPIQTSYTDGGGALSGVGKLLRVGAFGLGAGLDFRANNFDVVSPSSISNVGTVEGFTTSNRIGLNGIGGVPADVLVGLRIHAPNDSQFGNSSYLRTASYGETTFIQGAASATAWGAWRQVYTTANSGTLTTNITNDVIANITPTLNSKQNALGYTPIRQGTGPNQLANPVSIGWSSGSQLRVSVDSTDFGSNWPINSNTASKLQTPRGISLNGGATGGYAFDGSSDISIGVTITNDSHYHSFSTINGLQATLDDKASLTNQSNFRGAQADIGYAGAAGQIICSVTQAQAQSGFMPGMTFLRNGFYGLNLGLNTTNQLAVGGYSMGAVQYPLLHTGNAASLGFGGTTGTFGATGWARLGNGLIIQWGQFTSDGFVSFPTAFPTNCAAVTQMQSAANSGGTPRIALNGNPGTTGFNCTGVTSVALPARWIAIGY